MTVNTQPNILFVTHRVPYPPDKGDRIRTYHLLRYLAQYSNVYLGSLADEPVTPEQVHHLTQLTKRFVHLPHGKGKWIHGMKSLVFGKSISEGIFTVNPLVKLLKTWTTEIQFHGVVLSASSLAPYLVKPGFGAAITIVDSVDVDSQKWLDYAAASGGPKKWLYQLEGNRLRKTEQRMSQQANAVTFVSDRETQLVREYCEPANILTATNGVDLDYYKPVDHSGSKDLVFVGALDYKPNVDGIVWFAKSIWPTLRQHTPQSTLKIVGRRPVPAVTELGTIPGVEIVGQVPDVRPAMAEAAIIIAPLMIARGLQNKVLEAMAFGKPVLGSPAALAGFGHREYLPAIAVNTPDEWISYTVQLLNDQARREGMGIAGRKYAEAFHHWQHCLAPFGKILGLVRDGMS